MKKVIVTGGSGFIGSHLCERLLNDGCYVTCIDNFFTGSQENIQHLLDNPNFDVVNHDVTVPFYAKADEIYHLACPASPIHYQYDAVKTIKTCVMGTLNFLELAHKTGAKMLHASTSEVYGDPIIHPQVESYWGNVNPVGIRSCYDEGKRCAETLCMDFHRQFNQVIKIVRIFNTYGPRMLPNDGRVVSNFVLQAINDEDITIYGDGSQSRSFQYIDDFIEGIVRLMNNTEDSFTGPINIGNPNEFTIKELAIKVIELTNSKSKIVYEPLPSDDPKQRQPNIDHARELLHWEPKVQLNEGLKHIIDDFRKKYSNKK